MSFYNENSDKYYPLYEEARLLENVGHSEKALDIYLLILNKYIPSGSAYYDRAAIISEKLKKYEQAIMICDLAINNQQLYNLNFPIDTYLNRKKRLVKKLKPVIKTKSLSNIKNKT